MIEMYLIYTNLYFLLRKICNQYEFNQTDRIKYFRRSNMPFGNSFMCFNIGVFFLPFIWLKHSNYENCWLQKST